MAESGPFFAAALVMTRVLRVFAKEKEPVKTVASSSGQARANDVAATGNKDRQYRVAFLGSPPTPKVAANEEDLGRLQALGFNTVQLNIVWAYHPNGKPLNPEDLIDVPEGLLGATAMLGAQSPERRAQRHIGCPRRSQEQGCNDVPMPADKPNTKSKS